MRLIDTFSIVFIPHMWRLPLSVRNAMWCRQIIIAKCRHISCVDGEQLQVSKKSHCISNWSLSFAWGCLRYSSEFQTPGASHNSSITIRSPHEFLRDHDHLSIPGITWIAHRGAKQWRNTFSPCWRFHFFVALPLNSMLLWNSADDVDQFSGMFFFKRLLMTCKCFEYFVPDFTCWYLAVHKNELRTSPSCQITGKKLLPANAHDLTLSLLICKLSKSQLRTRDLTEWWGKASWEKKMLIQLWARVWFITSLISLGCHGQGN